MAPGETKASAFAPLRFAARVPLRQNAPGRLDGLLDRSGDEMGGMRTQEEIETEVARLRALLAEIRASESAEEHSDSMVLYARLIALQWVLADQSDAS